MGQVDRLQGSVDALSWGQTPLIGTGCQFDIVYNGKVDITFWYLSELDVLLEAITLFVMTLFENGRGEHLT